jgi:hypothetical protein
MGMTSQTKFAARVSLAAVAVVSAIGISAGAVSAAPSHPSAPSASPAGTYKYTDSVGNKEGLTLYANGTLAFSSGCGGLWVKSGSSIAMDITTNCGPDSWIYSGTVLSIGLSSPTHPGHFVAFFGATRHAGSWYAVRA